MRFDRHIDCCGGGLNSARAMTMVDWAFERDAEGMWRWTHAEPRGVTRSRRRFPELWDCVEDAKRHGLHERSDEEPRPALLH